MTRSRGILPRRIPWGAEEDTILRALWPRNTAAEIGALIDRPASAVQSRATRLKLKKAAAFFASPKCGRTLPGKPRGLKSRFKKGHVPATKGVRRPGYAAGGMARTQFRPGAKPYNYLPIGSTRINSLGVCDRKLADTGRTNRDWEAEHRLVWYAHHGPIPRGHLVAFKPGRKTNDVELITIDALELVSRRDWIARHRMDNHYPPEVCKAIRSRAALVRAIKHEEKRNGH